MLKNFCFWLILSFILYAMRKVNIDNNSNAKFFNYNFNKAFVEDTEINILNTIDGATVRSILLYVIN